MSDLTTKEIEEIYNKKRNDITEQEKIYKARSDRFVYIFSYLALNIVMDCRVSKAIELRAKLEFGQHDLILTKEQSVLKRILKVFSNEEMSLQQRVSDCYYIDLYFTECKLAIEVDERDHKDRGEKRGREKENIIKNS